MEFNDLTSIINCMKDWDRIRNTPAETARCLALGNYFTFTRDKPTAANLHAYPGISPIDNALYIFLIDAQADIDSSEAELFDAITTCRVQRNLGNTVEIPEEEARERIALWKERFRDWITGQITHQQQTEGIFKAFNIPSDYMEQNVEYTTIFALKPDTTAVTNYTADLITLDVSHGNAAYYDTVKPVPPFDIAPKSSFHLLSLV